MFSTHLWVFGNVGVYGRLTACSGNCSNASSRSNAVQDSEALVIYVNRNGLDELNSNYFSEEFYVPPFQKYLYFLFSSVGFACSCGKVHSKLSLGFFFFPKAGRSVLALLSYSEEFKAV